MSIIQHAKFNLKINTLLLEHCWCSPIMAGEVAKNLSKGILTLVVVMKPTMPEKENAYF
jgi:hypothetical protein